MRTEAYAWLVYGADPANPACEVVAYFTDDTHTPPQWQETLEGQRKQDVLEIIKADRQQAESTGQFSQLTINAGLRWYRRVILPSLRSSWEVILDEDGDPVPNPCETQAPPPAPGNFDMVLRQVGVSFRQSGDRVTLTITGDRVTGSA